VLIIVQSELPSQRLKKNQPNKNTSIHRAAESANSRKPHGLGLRDKSSSEHNTSTGSCPKFVVLAVLVVVVLFLL
jgi:hypothetical protein